jgi:hypothetical protein
MEYAFVQKYLGRFAARPSRLHFADETTGGMPTLAVGM